MFLLNEVYHNLQRIYYKFTIQNVSIKYSDGTMFDDFFIDLQYKMFLLNLVFQIYQITHLLNLQYKMFLLNENGKCKFDLKFKFTIQNVSIKYYKRFWG